MKYEDVLSAKRNIKIDYKNEFSALEQIASQKNYYRDMGIDGKEGKGLYIDFYYPDNRDNKLEEQLRDEVANTFGNEFQGVPVYVRFKEIPKPLYSN